MTFFKTRIFRILLVLSLLVLIIYPLYKVSSDLNEDDKDNILKIASEAPIETLNHLISDNVASSTVIENFTQGLFTYDENKRVIPGLAESWHKNDKKYIFNLRPNLKWSNGQPLTAHDFEFSWKTSIKNKKSPYPNYFEVFKNAKKARENEIDIENVGIKTIDNTHLEVELEKDSYDFIEMLTQGVFGPLNEEFYNKIGIDNYGTSADTVLSSGAFVLKDFKYDVGYTMQKNPYYWNKDQVFLDKVYASIIKEPSTQAALYDSGQLDVLNLNSDLCEKYSSDINNKNNIHDFCTPSLFYMYLSDKTQKKSPILGNENFRKAVKYSIDKAKITDYIMQNGSKHLDSIVPKKFGHLGDKTFREYADTNKQVSYNPQLAKEFFEKAKEELGNIELTFQTHYSESEESKKIFENLKSQVELNLPGVKMQLVGVPSNNFFKYLAERSAMSAYTGWAADYDDVKTFFSIFVSDSGFNYSNYSNSEYDKLVNEAMNSTDKTKSWELYKKAEDIILNDSNIIPLFQKGRRYLVNPKVKGFSYSSITPEVDYKYIRKQA